MSFELMVYSSETDNYLLFIGRIGDFVSHNGVVAILLDSGTDTSKNSATHDCQNFILNLWASVLVTLAFQPGE